MNRQLEKTRSTETCLTGLIGSTANQQKLREGYVFSVLTYNFFFSFLVVLKRIISDSFSKSSLGSSSTNTVSVFRLLWMLIPFFTLSSSFHSTFRRRPKLPPQTPRRQSRQRYNECSSLFLDSINMRNSSFASIKEKATVRHNVVK